MIERKGKCYFVSKIINFEALISTLVYLVGFHFRCHANSLRKQIEIMATNTNYKRETFHDREFSISTEVM